MDSGRLASPVAYQITSRARIYEAAFPNMRLAYYNLEQALTKTLVNKAVSRFLPDAGSGDMVGASWGTAFRAVVDVARVFFTLQNTKVFERLLGVLHTDKDSLQEIRSKLLPYVDNLGMLYLEDPSLFAKATRILAGTPTEAPPNGHSAQGEVLALPPIYDLLDAAPLRAWDSEKFLRHDIDMQVAYANLVRALTPELLRKVMPHFVSSQDPEVPEAPTGRREALAWTASVACVFFGLENGGSIYRMLTAFGESPMAPLGELRYSAMQFLVRWTSADAGKKGVGYIQSDPMLLECAIAVLQENPAAARRAAPWRRRKRMAIGLRSADLRSLVQRIVENSRYEDYDVRGAFSVLCTVLTRPLIQRIMPMYCEAPYGVLPDSLPDNIEEARIIYWSIVAVFFQIRDFDAMAVVADLLSPERVVEGLPEQEERRVMVNEPVVGSVVYPWVADSIHARRSALLKWLYRGGLEPTHNYECARSVLASEEEVNLVSGTPAEPGVPALGQTMQGGYPWVTGVLGYPLARPAPAARKVPGTRTNTSVQPQAPGTPGRTGEVSGAGPVGGPLHHAVWTSSVSSIRAIVCSPGGPRALNERNAFGETPLHLACLVRNQVAVEALLEAARIRLGGAIEHLLQAKDAEGFTPHQLATAYDNEPALAGLYAAMVATP